MVTAEEPCFSPELFAFLRELAAHNDREWFAANKARYVAEVQEPALAFVEDAGLRFPGEVSDHFAGSLFRIYRDTRFAKDKTPYKTHVGLYFRHARNTDTDTAGMYLHLEPGSVFMGAGIWHPGTPALKRIRDAIVARPAAWSSAVQAVAPTWEQSEGDKLKRAPTGYPSDHPLVEDLKRRSFAVISRLTQRQATASGFLDEVQQRAAAARPYMAFLSSALGVEY